MGFLAYSLRVNTERTECVHGEYDFLEALLRLRASREFELVSMVGQKTTPSLLLWNDSCTLHTSLGLHPSKQQESLYDESIRLLRTGFDEQTHRVCTLEMSNASERWLS